MMTKAMTLVSSIQAQDWPKMYRPTTCTVRITVIKMKAARPM